MPEPAQTPPALSLPRRLALALAAGVAFAAFNAYVAANAPPVGDARSDFDIVWYSARALLDGRDPYVELGPHAGASFRFPWGMYYPLTTVLAVTPLALLPLGLARALFVGAPVALLAWWMSARESWRPLGLLSYGVFFAARQAQWSTLATVSALHPACAGLLVLKPQLALPWVLASASWRVARNAAVGGALLLAASLAVDPGWIPRWVGVLEGAQHVRPLIVRPVAWLMLLGLLRWRRFEARLLVAFMFTPLNPLPYELVPLVLVPSSRIEMLALACATWATAIAQEVLAGRLPRDAVLPMGQDVLVVGAFLPALLMVLRRANEGPVPPWAEALAERVRLRFRTGWRNVVGV